MDKGMTAWSMPRRLVSGLVAGVFLLAACAPTPGAAPQQPAAGGEQAKPAAGAKEAAPAAKAPAQQAAAPAQKQAPSGPKRVTISYSTDIDGIFPYSHSTSTVYARFQHIFDTPVIYSPQENTWLPLLAESWTNPDPNTWVFKFREDVKFHDGTPLTAEDVVFSYTLMKEDPESKQQSTLANVTSIEAVDKYTVKFTMKQPDAAFLSRLDNRVILSKQQYEKLGREEAPKQPMGTGPYKFKEWVPGQRLVLTKNESYWGPDKPTWDEVIFRPIPEDEARITALLNGEVQVIEQIPSQSIDRVNNSGRATVEGTRGSRLMFVAINPVIEPLKNVKVRQAIAHAIDREGLVKAILQGRAYELDVPIGPGMYGYDPNLKPTYNYDPEKAKQLLAEAGYPNGFEVDFYTPVDRYEKDKDVSATIVNMLNAVGIKAKLHTPEWATFSDQALTGKGNYPLFLIGRGSVVDPSEYLQQYFMTGVTKRIQFSDEKVDELLKAQAAEFDPTKRVELLRQAMSEIMKHSPAAFLYQYEDRYGVANSVKFVPRGDEYIFAWDILPAQ